MDNLPLTSDEPTQLLKEAMTRQLYHRSVVTGEITIPAVPGMIDEYVKMCDDLFATVGRKFSDEELAHVRKVLEGQLAEAFARSPRSSIVITYNAPVGGTLHYQVNARWWTLAEAYENWISTRQPPLFGTEPDARIWALANEAADPTTHPVLEIGAGTGRNALPLARRGHPVDVVEMTPKFAEMIRTEAQRESLNVRVIVRDVFASTDGLGRDYQLIALSEVVPDFRTTQQLRNLLELAAVRLAPGGRIVFSVFLAAHGYTPDQSAREFGQQVYTGFFTRHEMAAAANGLPLELIADDSVYEYEKANLPEGAWPPTSWYAGWVSGTDLFPVERETSPVELRWLVFQKTH
ncbi:class I SAM-dependent methyltransferase [Mycobacterium riyadhense]|uniref:Methyltransferase type 12 n=1 Tax=Mycobacterium riyadhense TaxID=486698 RepID=A0A1X2CRP6_9MYCO|nr:class I SAM-dependent methyltransferase [Mycobacterium riyadhense]MCV7147127.1 class I SAM-dependent methyltransferase [Mycobacterium riyadhense]ORW78424.1 methyltransferase type 12 [Mycobacterium riyadhense]VTO96895.1 tellurite resistance protein TehB [Mycobacterium riyadhense]